VCIDNPLDFDHEIRERQKMPTLDAFGIPIVRYTLYENDAERIRALQQACQGNAHPFFFVQSAEGAVLQDEIGDMENLSDMVFSAIQESDATDAAKGLLVNLIRSNSPDEILGEYYKNIVLA
jgi:nucleoside-triphosphatase THEP1